MDPTARPRIKICCILSEAEAELAVRTGADALGLVSEMPSGPGVIDDDRIAAIAAAVPRTVETFLLTSRRSVASVVDQHRRAGTTTIQLVDDLADGTHADLRRALPGVRLVQVIHVTGPEAVDAALAAADAVDAVLLDSGNPALAIKELGGTGRRHDWNVSRRIREVVPKPVYLAGGLTPENARAAVDTVAPFGLDVCSGVRTDGRLDAAKLRAFIRAARPETAP